MEISLFDILIHNFILSKFIFITYNYFYVTLTLDKNQKDDRVIWKNNL